jgi:Multicopper oxidase
MITMTTKRSGRPGLALAAALLTLGGLVMQEPAHALPVGAPKIGMVCTPGAVSGSTHTFDLQTGTGDIQTPDGNSVFMWSYADTADPTLNTFQYPGPNLCVTQGENVVINLHNTLPEASSVLFPGQAGVTATGDATGLLTMEAAATNGNASYSFTAGSPGTYLYQSGTNMTKQVEMGLYGALIVRPNTASCPVMAGTDCAYNPATRFDSTHEYLLLLAEIDPALHHAVEVGSAYDWTTRHNRYFTVNGRSFPDTIQDNGSVLLPNQPYGALVRLQPTSPANQPALIRMINAGVDNHPFHPHGNHTTQIAQDGRLIAPTEHFGETIGSGQTEDFLIRWDNMSTDTSGQAFNDDWDPVDNPLPVAQPNYRNLTFKDGDTWYSGDPYLGYKGTLPTGTLTQNVCGEWYFPWHSHALNEFSNFDEGFGGMATLLRVDPAGGCFAAPGSSNLVGGALKGGSVANLAVSDDVYYQVNPKTTTLNAPINTTGSPTTTLASAVSSTTATTITVSSNAGWPTASANNPYFIRVDNEIIRVVGKGGGPGVVNWTVQRGQLGSTAATHLSSAGVTYVVGVASASGFPASGAFFIRIDNEVMQVTGGQGTRGWTVTRGQLGTLAAIHSNNATVSALATDWYAGFTGVPGGSQNLRVTYEGKNCGNTSGSVCTSIASNLPQQTVKICDWTISGAAGCSSATSNGWVTLPAPQNIAVGSTDVNTTWASLGPWSRYVGTGAFAGQVRILVHTQRWAPSNPTPFSTWGDFMQVVYDAP